jgi:hypothetical protein
MFSSRVAIIGRAARPGGDVCACSCPMRRGAGAAAQKCSPGRTSHWGAHRDRTHYLPGPPCSTTRSPPLEGVPGLEPTSTERLDLSGGRVEVVDDEIEVHPVLPRLAFRESLEADREAFLRRRQKQEAPSPMVVWTWTPSRPQQKGARRFGSTESIARNPTFAAMMSSVLHRIPRRSGSMADSTQGIRLMRAHSPAGANMKGPVTGRQETVSRCRTNGGGARRRIRSSTQRCPPKPG